MKTKNLKRLLNLNFTDVTNRTHSVGEYDLPYIAAKITEYPDYIALYKDKGDYLRTDKTCVSFYNYDNAFDELCGIWNAIYYDVAEWKNFYRERFAGVKYFIAPDYSLCGDINKIENLHRLFRARIVSIWLTLELKAVVIPNITYSNEEIFPNMLDGMENCEVVAFSTKGLRNSGKKLSLMKKALRHTVDNLPKLRTIIIYTLSKDDEKIYSDRGHGTGGSPQGTLEQNDYTQAVDNLTNKFPPNDSQIKHIFRPKEGHLSDTPENRKLIENVANDPANYKGKDKYGKIGIRKRVTREIQREIKIRGVISETKIFAHCNVQGNGFCLR